MILARLSDTHRALIRRRVVIDWSGVRALPIEDEDEYDYDEPWHTPPSSCFSQGRQSHTSTSGYGSVRLRAGSGDGTFEALNRRQVGKRRMS